MREVQVALQNIETRNYNKDALKVKLKGHKIKFKDHSYCKPIAGKMNPVVSKQIDDQMMSILKRRGAKFRDGNRPQSKS